MLVMEVVATIKERHDIDIVSKVNNLLELGIMRYRFNFAKISSERDETSLFETINKVVQIDENIKIMIDLPYPGKKNRLVCRERSIQINCNQEYVLHLYKNGNYSISEDEFFLEDETDGDLLCEGAILVYDMGEGAFSICNKKSSRVVKLKALNSFKLSRGKGLTIGCISKRKYASVISRICSNFFLPDSFVLSFVEDLNDVRENEMLKKVFPSVKLISKIETQNGIENIEDIINYSDGIMLGRGDLCLHSPICNLMDYERIVATMCKQHNCDCYFASGFLNSYLKSYLPTHSDIIDFSYAAQLNPNYLVLNTDLILSDRIKDVIKFISKVSFEIERRSNDYL